MRISSSRRRSQAIHVDAAVPDPLPPWIIRTNVNFILQDYTMRMVHLVCRSHKLCRRQMFNWLLKDLIPLEATGAWCFGTATLAKSGHNQTDVDRFACLDVLRRVFWEKWLWRKIFIVHPEKLLLARLVGHLRTCLDTTMELNSD